MRTVRLVATVLLIGGSLVASVPPAAATASPPPHAAVGGFSTPAGDGFSIVYADGSVRPGPFGDAFSLRLGTRITAAAPTPTGDGYWEVAADGNVLSYGDAGAFGGMGGIALQAPIFAIAPTKSGLGYLLAGRDGGVFAFGDATFRGSAGGRHLNQPIVGMTTVPAKGYRLVARDGGVFTFGAVTFAGSLPSRHVRVTNVVGMASTPSGNGYWIVRSSGQVYAFGDAQRFGGVRTSACDPIAAIVADPDVQGYRLVTDSGRTIAFGRAPAGNAPTGSPRSCGHTTARIELPATTIAPGAAMTGDLIIDNETGRPLALRTAGRCEPSWGVTLTNPATPNAPVFAQGCKRRPETIPAGETQRAFTLPARLVTTCRNCPTALAPGSYVAKFFDTGGKFPPIASIPVTVVAPV